MSTELREVLAHLRGGPGGGLGRTPRGVSPSSHSSSSHEELRPRRERRLTRHPTDDLRDMRIDLPEFEGNLKPDLFIEWIQALERFFEIKEFSDEKAFKVAVLKLKSYASLWYENLKKQRSQEGKSRIRSWSKLKKLMSKRFLPDNYKRDLYLRVSSLSQGRLSVEEYIREFEQLQIRSGIEEEPEQTMARFIRGLDPSLAKKVDIQPYWCFEDVCKLAIKVEKHSKRRGVFNHPHTNPAAPLEPNVPTKPESTPRNVGGQDPRKAISKELPKQLDGKKCFKCQGYGHFIANCPNRRVLTLKEMEEIDQLTTSLEEEREKEGEETTVLAPDVGDLLVIERVLHTQGKAEEKDQREHIFHSRCTIQDKICDLVIDGGSSANVAST